MPTISNLELSIDGVHGLPHLRSIKVNYRIGFNTAERMASSVFRENITLYGEDGTNDEVLHVMRNSVVQATQPSVDRQFTQQVHRLILDEDRDTVVFGRPVIYQDQVYARVTLLPFEPSSAGLNSNIVTGTFGEFGNP